MLDVFLPCVPPTANHQNKRIVRIGRFHTMADRAELVAAKEMLDVLLMPHRPAAPVKGHASLTLEFTWPWRAGDSKKKRALGRIRKDSRPDVDNLAKTTTDRLVAMRFLEDDAQVCELTVRKFFGDRPGIRIVVASISEVA